MVHTDCNCAALRQASRFVTRLYDEALAPLGLGINQYSILARLARLGPLRVQSLAHSLVMDRSTIGHLVRPLEKRGLVALTIDPVDSRCRTVSLTSAGQALLTQARPVWALAQAAFERQFGPADAAALRNVLAKVVMLRPPPSASNSV